MLMVAFSLNHRCAVPASNITELLEWQSILSLCLSMMLEPIPTLEDVPADSARGGWQPHTMTACEIYILYVCWPGLIIQRNAGEDPSLSTALNGSSR